MKILDRILNIPPEKAIPGDINYEVSRFGAKASLVGLVALAGGLAAGSLGIEFGNDVSLSGCLLTGLGGMALIGGLGGINTHE